MSDDFPAGLAFVEDDGLAPDTFNVLLFGPPKSGKSTAAATAPGPILYLNAEGKGALGFARKVALERGTRIHEVALPNGKNGQSVLVVMRAAVEHLRSGNEPVVQTVVVDTIGKVREALANELVVPGAKNSIQQWGKVADTVAEFVRTLRDMPVNVVFLAHTDQVDDAESGRTVRPLIGGKATEIVPGEVDVVAYTGAVAVEGEPVRYVGQLVDGKGRTGLGDRSGALAEAGPVRDLDLSVWLEDYQGGLTPEDLPFAPERESEDDGQLGLDEGEAA